MQGWLESPRAASFGGRFVSVAISHLGKYDQALATTLLKLAGHKGGPEAGRWTMDIEFEFHRRGRKRRADIAIFDGDVTESPVCLVEIKYDDQASDRNGAQLKDYIGYCASNRETAFLCLTQYSMPARSRAPIYRECLFSEFADELHLRNGEFSPSMLLIDYLREKGLVMEPIDIGALGRLMNRLFNSRYGAGRQQKNRFMIRDIPETFRATMTNVDVIGSEISRNLRIRRVPVIDFEVIPWVYPNRVVSSREIASTKESRKITGRPRQVDGRARAGGVLYAFAQSYLRGGARRRGTMGVDYGYRFEIDPGEKVQCFLYGAVWGDGIAVNSELNDTRFESLRRVGPRILGSRTACIEAIRQTLRKAAREANRKKKTSLATKQVLRRLLRSL
jgi:hypothetical protein